MCVCLPTCVLTRKCLKMSSAPHLTVCVCLHAYLRRKCFSNKAISRCPLTSLRRSDSVLWKSWMVAAIVGDPEPACAPIRIYADKIHKGPCTHTHTTMNRYTDNKRKKYFVSVLQHCETKRSSRNILYNLTHKHVD